MGIAHHLAVLRVADDNQVAALGKGGPYLVVDVIHEGAGGVEDLETQFTRAFVEGRRHAMGGEYDGRLAHLLDGVHSPHPQSFHLLHNPLVVHHLAEDGGPFADGCKAPHLQVGNPHARTKAVLRCSFYSHLINS